MTVLAAASKAIDIPPCTFRKHQRNIKTWNLKMCKDDIMKIFYITFENKWKMIQNSWHRIACFKCADNHASISSYKHRIACFKCADNHTSISSYKHRIVCFKCADNHTSISSYKHRIVCFIAWKYENLRLYVQYFYTVICTQIFMVINNIILN
jgi:hypothetical protein